MTSASEQLDVLCRGVVDIHVRAELEARITAGKKLRVKAGFDPTRPDLHVGHTVLMQKMRQFQELGHTVIFLVGDFTAMVGDPTGKNEQRPRLTREEVHAAAETYQQQAFKVLDKSRTEVRYNSEWLDKLNAVDMIELTSRYTVARTLERRDFKQRFERHDDIYMHELLYPLLQGYDSVALNSDVELGGTDQLFNLLVGRTLMPRYDLEGQIVMTTPILEGTNARVEDGRIVGPKMSKSSNNFIGIDEPPAEMFNKVMLVDDGVIWRYLDLLSSKSTAEIAALRADVDGGKANVIAVKEAFAIELVTRFHDAAAAGAALEKRKRVAKGEAPDDVPRITLTREAGAAAIPIGKALFLANFAASGSEGARLVKGNAVQVDGEVAAPNLGLVPGREYLVRVGSKNRRFAILVIA